MAKTAWDPGQYNRFAGEREKPFWDLAELLHPVASPAMVDLGCGDGRLTATLAQRLGASDAVGVDSSPEMLAEAGPHAGPAMRFVPGDLAGWHGKDLDIVFSNSALHWVADHPAVLARWRDSLGPGGQLAVQVPANPDHPSHAVSSRLAEEWMGPAAPPDPVADNVLSPVGYAEVLFDLGFAEQHVRLQVYPHLLPSSADVVEWVKGTSLTRFKAVMSDDDYIRFVDEYRSRLLAELGERAPYFYAFKRILIWGRLPQ